MAELYVSRLDRKGAALIGVGKRNTTRCFAPVSKSFASSLSPLAQLPAELLRDIWDRLGTYGPELPIGDQTNFKTEAQAALNRCGKHFANVGSSAANTSFHLTDPAFQAAIDAGSGTFKTSAYNDVKTVTLPKISRGPFEDPWRARDVTKALRQLQHAVEQENSLLASTRRIVVQSKLLGEKTKYSVTADTQSSDIQDPLQRIALLRPRASFCHVFDSTECPKICFSLPYHTTFFTSLDNVPRFSVPQWPGKETSFTWVATAENAASQDQDALIKGFERLGDMGMGDRRKIRTGTHKIDVRVVGMRGQETLAGRLSAAGVKLQERFEDGGYVFSCEIGPTGSVDVETVHEELEEAKNL